MADRPRVLVLGGTTEALALAELLGGRCVVVYSLAGRTRAPAWPAGAERRLGGFGGADGLARWLDENAAAAVIDATHPFAARIAANAARAAARTGRPRLKLLRPAWSPRPGDRWLAADDMAAAARLAAEAGTAAFLSVGRQQLAAFAGCRGMRFLARTVDPAAESPLADAVFVADRGPFTAAREETLLRRHGIDVVVSRNAGGDATRAKIEAARRLGLPVVMVARPPPPPGEIAETAERAAAWVEQRVLRRLP